MMKFNYKYQVWYDDQANYAVQDCAHPNSTRKYEGNGVYKACCNQYALAGFHIQDVEANVWNDLCVQPIDKGAS